MKPEILVIDGHTQFVEDLVRFLADEFEVVVAPRELSLDYVVEQIQMRGIRLALIDAESNEDLGILAEIRRRLPALRILVVSLSEGRRHVESLITAGANGFVSKLEPGERLRDAIRAVMADSNYLRPGLTDRSSHLASQGPCSGS